MPKEKAEKALNTRASAQNKMLSSYKTYYKVSEKAELDYWDAARKQFKAGTDERIVADQEYLRCQADLSDANKLAECDQDYYEQVQGHRRETERSNSPGSDGYLPRVSCRVGKRISYQP